MGLVCFSQVLLEPLELELFDAIVELLGDFVEVVGGDNGLGLGEDGFDFVLALAYLIEVVFYLLDLLLIEGNFDELHVALDRVAHELDGLEILLNNIRRALLPLLHHFDLLLLHIVELLLEVRELLLELWQVYKSLSVYPLANGLDSSFGDVSVHPGDFILESLYLLLELHNGHLDLH